MITYNKLVRDKIPDIIKADGGECVYHVAKNDEFVRVLNAKLFEEVQELTQNPCAEEIADVLEIIETLSKFHGIGLGHIKEVKTMKRKERGGFNQRLVLDEATKKLLRPSGHPVFRSSIAIIVAIM